MRKHRDAFGDTLEAVTADSGYCSDKNLLYLKENVRTESREQDGYTQTAEVYGCADCSGKTMPKRIKTAIKS